MSIHDSDKTILAESSRERVYHTPKSLSNSEHRLEELNPCSRVWNPLRYHYTKPISDPKAERELS